MLATRIEMLQQMPIFGAISAEVLQFLLEPATSVFIPAREFFFREGDDEARCMYVLETGRVAVLKSWGEREFLVRHLGPGDCFGEMALLDLLPRSASVRAEEDSTAIELSPSHLYRLFERDAPQFALIQMNLGREMSRRLRETNELLFQASMGEAPAQSGHVFHTT